MSRTVFLGGVVLMLGVPFFSGDAILAPSGASATSAAAQPSQPIYLQYDGYVKNTDGTYTLSFGYFNLNQVAVSIQPGEDNTFTPGPADRNQPILFEKGRRRFACSMVVTSDFDGALQWTVRIAGKTSTTTSKMLDSLYELELNSAKRVTSGLDQATAPRGVCVNRPPSVQVINPLADINAGADKLAVSWKKISGPGEIAFSDTSQPVTRARFSAVGVYELELSTTDTERAGSVKIKVTVN